MSRARDLGSSINSTVAGKNFIINGAMDFWQRGTTSSSAGSQFVADRWNTYRGGYQSGLTVSRQLVNDIINLPGIQYCIRLQRDSGNTATQGIALAQSIESINSFPMAGKTVTLSFWARAGATFISSGGQLRPFILSGTGIDEAPRNGLSNMVYITNNYLSLTSSWVRYSVTGNVPANASQVCLSIDGVVSGTAGATDYYEVTGVQLEIASSATPFSRAGGDIQGELSKCHRYYYKSLGGQLAVGFNSTDAIISIQNVMRSTPSVSLTGVVLIDRYGVASYLQSATTLAAPSVYASSNTTGILLSAFTGLTAGIPYVARTDNGSIILSAEL
jgi:hypothetical protein